MLLTFVYRTIGTIFYAKNKIITNQDPINLNK